MSDYCRQCTKEIFGPDMKPDLAGLTTEQETHDGLYASVLCEGCGPTQVDHDGTCIHHNAADPKTRCASAHLV
jgi:hypothetical protein